MSGRAGLFLDLDGTLADSIPVLRAAYYESLAHFGVRGSDEEFDRCNGIPLAEVIALLRAAHGIEVADSELAGAFALRVAKAYADCLPRSGAEALLAAATERDMPVAIVTSSHEGFTHGWLERHGLASFVSCVVHAESTARGKPAPDPYLEALARTGCEAGRSIAVEDSLHGVASAVAADIPTWRIGPPPEDPGAWPPVRGFVAGLEAITALLTV